MNNNSFLFNNSMSSSGGSIYSLLSEYNNIKSGTYYKVVKAYYAKQKAEISGTKDIKDSKKDTNALSETTKELNQTQTDAKSLMSAADKLIDKGKDSLFKEKDITVKNEDGTETTTKGYDTDAIYSAVKKFADSYNSLLDSASSSSSNTVKNQAANMVKNTKTYEKLLGKVGITIGSNNKLSVDEKAFKAADMSTVKTLFNGNSSFAYSTSSRASMINFSAASEANKTKTYTNTGKYNSDYTTGSMMDSIF